MISDQIPRKVQVGVNDASSSFSFSPKSSPRGSRSPMANTNLSRNDSTGTLKMTISAGKHPAVVHSGPFYLMKVESN